MDFIISNSFQNEPLIIWTFLEHFCHHFWVVATAKQQQTHPKVMTKTVKKCSNDQRFIQKRNTTYKNHTLVKQINKQTTNKPPSSTIPMKHLSITHKDGVKAYWNSLVSHQEIFYILLRLQKDFGSSVCVPATMYIFSNYLYLVSFIIT